MIALNEALAEFLDRRRIGRGRPGPGGEGPRVPPSDVNSLLAHVEFWDRDIATQRALLAGTMQAWRDDHPSSWTDRQLSDYVALLDLDVKLKDTMTRQGCSEHHWSSGRCLACGVAVKIGKAGGGEPI